jgi:hypothetical protein
MTLAKNRPRRHPTATTTAAATLKGEHVVALKRITELPNKVHYSQFIFEWQQQQRHGKRVVTVQWGKVERP